MVIASDYFFLGVDWATQHHDVCLCDSQGAVLSERRYSNTAQGLAELVQHVQEATKGQVGLCRVAIETKSGPIIDELLANGFSVFAINPLQVDRFRDRFWPSGAKDDRRDARVLADSIRTDPRAFRELELEDPKVVELREWSRLHDEIQRDRGRVRSQLQAQLRRYYPEILELDSDTAKPWVLDLLELCPTPKKAKRRQRATFKRILNEHKIRRLTPADVKAILRRPSLRVAPGVVESASAHVRLLIERLRLLNEQLKTAQRKLDELLEDFQEGGEGQKAQAAEQREANDVEILLSFPGVGRIVASTLLSEARDSLRDRDYKRLRAISGAAPVTRKTGKRGTRGNLVIKMRRACHRGLRQVLFYWARAAVRSEGRWREQYSSLRAKGYSAARCLRSVADSLLRVLIAALKEGSLYDPDRGRRKAKPQKVA